MRRLPLAAAAAALLVVTGAGAPALAYWTASAAGGSTVSAATLGAPGATATALSATSVRVEVTPSASGPAPTSYVVSAAGWSCTGTSCTRTGLQPSTTYRFDVVARLASWSSPSVTVSATTLPAPAVPSSPALTAASDSGRVGDGITRRAPVVTGTASPGSLVRLWAGSPATGTLLGTDTASGAGTWTVDASAAGTDRTVQLTATATLNGLTSSASAPSTLHVDTVVPVLVATPSCGGGTLTTIGATVYCNRTTFSVAVGLTDANPDGVYRTTGSAGTPPAVPANAVSGTDTPAADGTYRYAAWDLAENSSAAATFVRDTVAPSLTSLRLANGGTAGRLDAGDGLAVTFSEPMAAASVCTGAVSLVVTDGGRTGQTEAPDTATVGGCSLGTLGLGASWVARNQQATTLTVPAAASWDAAGTTLTLVLGTVPTTGAGVTTVSTPGSPTVSVVAGPTDLATNPLALKPASVTGSGAF